MESFALLIVEALGQKKNLLAAFAQKGLYLQNLEKTKLKPITYFVIMTASIRPLLL